MAAIQDFAAFLAGWCDGRNDDGIPPEWTPVSGADARNFDWFPEDVDESTDGWGPAQNDQGTDAQ
jgi:hypothetical protein